MNVLVLDGNENQSVASVRSLARAGHSVVVGATTSWSKAGWSRYARGTFTYPSPEQGALGFVKQIAAELQRHAGSFILPMTELSTLPLSAHRDLIFSAGGKLVLPPHATVLQAFDKQHTTMLAASLGIPTPHTWFADSMAQAERIADAIRYPVVVKPRSTNQVGADGRVSVAGKPAYATNPEEFRSTYQALAERSSNILVQEFVEGVGSGYFALMKDGEPRAEFFHRRIRDVRPTGSGSSLRVSIEPQTTLRNAGRSILQALRWQGVAMVEFRLRPDGTPVFVEVNGRFWNSLALAIYAGVDFPAMLAQMVEAGDIARPATYRAGVRCRWFLGDVRHLIETLAGPPRGYPGHFPKRLPTLLSVLKPVPGTYHDNFSVRDPLPEIADWLDFALRRAPEAWRRATAQPTNQVLGALHVHSQYSDGEYTLGDLRKIFVSAGCRFVCVTDHAESFDEPKLESYLHDCARLSDSDFFFVPGLEYECDGGMHILGYGCRTVLNSKDPQRVVAHIQEHGGVAVIAHPANRMFSAIEEFSVLPHGIEVWNTKYDGRYAPRPETFQLLHRLQQQKPTLRAFYGQDLHWKRQFRGLFTILSGPTISGENILNTLREGEFWGSRGQLRLPSSGQLDQRLLSRFELEQRNSARLRRLVKYGKEVSGRFGLSVPGVVKSQLRRIF
jgi:predicted ATP-grasp superfamily ATP-dependent carboligase